MEPPTRSTRTSLPIIFSLTLFALIIHGYHPYAEDAAVYLPGVKRLLYPGLYGPHPDFVLAPMRTSLFAPFVASLVHATGLSLPWVLLLLYSACVSLVLLAGEQIAGSVSASRSGRAAAVSLLACWLTLPVAGTSLLIVDPYLTARSISTPLVLFSIAFALRCRWLYTFFSLALAAAFHPLMAGYGCAAIVTIAALNNRTPTRRIAATTLLTVAGLLLALAIYLASPPEMPGYRDVALSRYYWFLADWHWYELLGAIAPLIVLFLLSRKCAPQRRSALNAGTLLGSISLLIAATFARASLSTHLVARLQPLRALQLTYIVMILSIGAYLGEHWLRRRPLRWLSFMVVAALPMLLAARETYPNSNHFEAPWVTPRNPWQQAFLWARDHTPPQSIFALDAFYITKGAQEDAHGFRAIAERNALPDYSKDGGEASVAPDLTPQWQRGVAAQTGLDNKTDAERLRSLATLNPTWIVLPKAAQTSWSCPYMNPVVKICSVPAASSAEPR